MHRLCPKKAYTDQGQVTPHTLVKTIQINMILFSAAILIGLIFLILSADRFVDAASVLAQKTGLSPLIIGMLIVGIGTSAPEILVSALAAMQDNTGLALGNAYGSNITNIAFILGLTALISPIPVQSGILRKELPILCLVTGASIVLLWDRHLGFWDAVLFMVALLALLVWLVKTGQESPDNFTVEAEANAQAHLPKMSHTGLVLVLSLAVMMAASQGLIWGAEGLAKALGVSDLVIGLTVLAFGTSVPELASSLIAARKNQHALALGNVIGSNLFNTLGVVGVAGLISPSTVPADLLTRDLPLVALLSLSLFVIGMGWRGRTGRVNRWEGGLLLAVYVGYMATLAASASAV